MNSNSFIFKIEFVDLKQRPTMAIFVEVFFPLIDRRLTRPLRHASVTSDMLLAHRPMAWIVAATLAPSDPLM